VPDNVDRTMLIGLLLLLVIGLKFSSVFDSGCVNTMGKNKNKTLAQRQEKILKKMAQPLYNQPTDSVYLVITEPFGMGANPAARGTHDINRFSSWISWVFRRPSVLEAVYTMSTVS